MYSVIQSLVNLTVRPQARNPERIETKTYEEQKESDQRFESVHFSNGNAVYDGLQSKTATH